MRPYVQAGFLIMRKKFGDTRLKTPMQHAKDTMKENKKLLNELAKDEKNDISKKKGKNHS